MEGAIVFRAFVNGKPVNGEQQCSLDVDEVIITGVIVSLQKGVINPKEIEEGKEYILQIGQSEARKMVCKECIIAPGIPFIVEGKYKLIFKYIFN